MMGCVTLSFILIWLFLYRVQLRPINSNQGYKFVFSRDDYLECLAISTSR